MSTPLDVREILDLPDGGEVTLRVTSWERKKGSFVTQRHPEGEVLDYMRLHLAPGSKATGPNWWDVTSKTLQAQLAPLLTPEIMATKRVVIHKVGVAPKARFSVTLLPLEAGK